MAPYQMGWGRVNDLLDAPPITWQTQGAMAKKNVKTKAKSASKPAKAAKTALKAKPASKLAKAVKAVKAVASKLAGKSSKPSKAAKPAKAVKVEIQAVAKSTKSAVSVKGGKIKVTETEVVAVAVQTKAAKGAGKKGAKADGVSAGASRKSLTNSCREITCDSIPTSAGYCRAHYIKNWKKIKRKEAVLKDGKLNQYVEELISKYPEKYIEAIRFDLANDKEFMKVIRDLELDEAIDDIGSDDSEAPEAVAVEGVSSRRGADLDDDSDIF